MQSSRVQHIRLAAGFAVLMTLLAGSVGLSHGESRGVKLSDAMEASAQESDEDVGGSKSRRHDSDDDECNDELVGGGGAWIGAWFGASYVDAEYTWQLPVDVRYEVPFSSDIQGLTHFTLTPISFEDEAHYVGLYLGGALVDFERGSLPDRGTKDQSLFEAGLTYRRYLNSSYTAFSPYISGSIAYQLLLWEYRTPVISDGDRISYDSLSGVDGSLAFGVTTRRDSHVSAYGEIGVGATGFFGTTSRGFDNDVFDTFGYFSVRVGISLKF